MDAMERKGFANWKVYGVLQISKQIAQVEDHT